MSNNQYTKIDVAIANHQLVNHPEYLQEIIEMYGCVKYFNKYLQHLGYSKFKDALVNKPIENMAKYILLCFEGAVYCNLDNAEIKQLLLISLFRYNQSAKEATYRFDEIHNALDEKHQLSVEKEDYILAALKGIKETTKDQTLRVILDSAIMLPFHLAEDSQLEHIQDLVNQEYSKTNYRDPDNKLMFTVVTGKLIAVQFKTNWAKIRAFKINWPELIKTQTSKYKTQFGII